MTRADQSNVCPVYQSLSVHADPNLDTEHGAERLYDRASTEDFTLHIHTQQLPTEARA